MLTDRNEFAQGNTRVYGIFKFIDFLRGKKVRWASNRVMRIQTVSFERTDYVSIKRKYESLLYRKFH